MQTNIKIINHPKDGYKIDLNRLIDLTKVFIKRDTEDFNRDFCVYCFEDENGISQYYGMGKYYDLTCYSKSKWLKSRPFSHKNDLLTKTINFNWTCRIIGLGMTVKEAHILEAYMIKKSDRTLSKIGTNIWNKNSLINKRRERKWENSEYINNLNGNYIRSAA